MHQAHGPVQADVKYLAGYVSVSFRGLVRSLTVESRLQELEVNIAKLVKEEAVRSSGCVGKFVVLEGLVGFLGTSRKFGKDPAVLPGKWLVQPQAAWELEVVAKIHQPKARCVPDLVAEMPVTNHTVDVQIHISALKSVCQKAEAESVSTALWDAVRKVRCLSLLSLLDLFIRKISFVKFLLQIFQGDSINDLERINHVTKTLGHLSTVRISHHGMQVDRVERKLAGEADGHHDHSCHPEEKDVMTCLKERSREEGIKVVIVLDVRPAKHGEWEEAR
mmetsp:Transcript_46094/g.82944  ORF Transcript_46094/g.82944 Transcript_46094/m.82944 type:complete len:277 (+) Transcript_46094:714-1544(+)